MRLKRAAGWNQLQVDWEMLLDAGCEGNYVATYNGIDVGTITAMTYERHFSWIGMLLVDPAYRRRGIGTALLKAAIDRVEKVGAVRLDATPTGKKLYDTLGFREEYRLARWQRMAAPHLREPNIQCHRVNRQTFPENVSDIASELVRFDSPIFGAERGEILNTLLQNAPQYAHYVQRGEQVIGYCLGRSGSDFEQIGPIVAREPDVAQALMLSALQSCAHKTVIMDVLVRHKDWLTFLRDFGFSEQRPFIRMCRGTLRHSGRPGKQFAIAGPEIG
jgi:predicted GNAT family N-acyltransferase